ncbi:MAG: hypothetical protein GY761_19255 [Hyphomicrobiales bacterium]|nr:hypothetical protein [Hyphomicrobiales bacterium]
MVSQLIEQIQQISSEIELALEADDRKLVSKLDNTLTQNWKNLLQYETKYATEARILAEFLIDQLFDIGTISIHNLQIKNKLLALCGRPEVT